MTTENLVLYLAHGDRDQHEILRNTLAKLNYRIGLATQSGHELIERCRTAPPDFVLAGPGLNDISSFEMLNAVAEMRCCPAIALVKSDQIEVAKDEMVDRMMGIVVMPATKNQLRPAMYVAHSRFHQMKNLRRRLSSLRRELYPADGAPLI